jgi:hypothetical protein
LIVPAGEAAISLVSQRARAGTLGPHDRASLDVDSDQARSRLA